MEWFLYDNGLRHEKVKLFFNWLKKKRKKKSVALPSEMNSESGSKTNNFQ